LSCLYQNVRLQFPKTLTVPHELLTLALLEMLADLLLPGLIFASAYPSRTFKVTPWC